MINSILILLLNSGFGLLAAVCVYYGFQCIKLYNNNFKTKKLVSIPYFIFVGSVLIGLANISAIFLSKQTLGELLFQTLGLLGTLFLTFALVFHYKNYEKMSGK